MENGQRTVLRKEIKKRTVGYVTAAFGLVAGLAWNDAIKGLIEYWFPAEGGTLIAKFVYAFFITLVVVIVSIYLARLFASDEEPASTDASQGGE